MVESSRHYIIYCEVIYSDRLKNYHGSLVCACFETGHHLAPLAREKYARVCVLYRMWLGKKGNEKRISPAHLAAPVASIDSEVAMTTTAR